ncbi:GTP pyrophosphokinase [Metabacillus elymi]|uniref:GTP pyrophosphokinase family protein n=1 Tax=Metabacillus elymi TaxID=2745198 RepID=A0ABX6S9M3_9BACI|nr:GTP pyrophosphokinase family protein [Metabacillus sp. KUDC1714]QNF28496.1 GTP pyrophosphokinase family protein [Metabacillus sp. KUDC1714]
MRQVRTGLEEWRNFLLIYKFALDEINTKLKILNEEFKFVHQHNPIEHIKSRIKDPASIIRKLQRKGLTLTKEKAVKHIHDLAGVRIICAFVSDIYKIYDMISGQDDITILKVKDYLKEPKPNGYKSLHLLVEIPVFLSNLTEQVKVEIQIRTIAMDFWASLEHKIYYKYDKSVPVHVKDELKEAAEMAQFLDHKMKRIHDEMMVYKVKEKLEITRVII